MIKIILQLSETGLITGCDVRGHAETGRKGEDLVCAAVSVLVRTAARTLEQQNDVILEGKASEPGKVGFSLVSFRPGIELWLKGLGDVLMTGILDIQDEYPESCLLEIIKEECKE